MPPDLANLKARLEEAAEGLPGVVPKRLFGCDGLFAAGNIFAMIWKEGRIGLKLPDPDLESELRALDGSSSWCPGGKMTISSWVFVPPRFHDDPAVLAPWVKKAHALARAAKPKRSAAGKPARAAPRKRK